MKKLIMLIAVMTVLVSCNDDTATATARDGKNGQQGLQGEQGLQGVQGETGLTGKTGATGAKGETGQAGQNGKDGKDGKDGESCTIKATANGALITCANGVSVAVNNGTDGRDGENGQDGQDGAAGNSVEIPRTTLTNVAANSCTQVDENIWVQAHDAGQPYDVYRNANCLDAQGEECDNVVASIGRINGVNGTGATICPIAPDKKVYASRDVDGNLLVRVETLIVE